MSFLETFRTRISEASDATTVLVELNSLPDFVYSAPEIEHSLLLMVASLTPHLDLPLMERLLESSASNEIDKVAYRLLGNSRISDREWDSTIAGLLDSWTALLASSRFEVRLAVQQLLGDLRNIPNARGSAELLQTTSC